jgi:hypothetical protein
MELGGWIEVGRKRDSQKLGIKNRIIHSHIDTSSIESTANWKRQIYNNLMKWWIDKNSTVGFATAVNGLWALPTLHFYFLRQVSDKTGRSSQVAR